MPKLILTSDKWSQQPSVQQYQQAEPIPSAIPQYQKNQL